MDTAVTSTLRHLRAFQMVARLNNIRRAAEAVHLTQPAVTLAIAKLEGQAGAILFDRQSRGTYPTAAGEILAARIDRMFDRIETALSELAPAPARGCGSVADRITRAQVRALAVAAGDSPADDGEGGVSRSSLHRTVRDLERLLGAPLVRNSAAGLTATPTGVELSRRLAVALAEIDCGIAEIADERQRQDALLRIGALPMTGSFVIGPVLNDLAQACPEARLEVRTGDRDHLTRALLRGEVDLVVGLLREQSHPDAVAQEPLVELPYVLVARQGHPLAGRSALRLADLEGFDWVAPNPGTVRRETFDRLVDGMSKKPAANLQASSLSTLRLLVAGSDRLALLTRFEFEQDRQDGDLCDLDFWPIAPVHRLGITTRANWQPTPLHARFADLVRGRASRIARRHHPALSIAAE